MYMKGNVNEAKFYVAKMLFCQFKKIKFKIGKILFYSILKRKYKKNILLVEFLYILLFSSNINVWIHNLVHKNQGPFPRFMIL